MFCSYADYAILTKFIVSGHRLVKKCLQAGITFNLTLIKVAVAGEDQCVPAHDSLQMYSVLFCTYLMELECSGLKGLLRTKPAQTLRCLQT